MELIHNIVFWANVVVFVSNGWLLVRQTNLISKLKRDLRIASGYRAYYEERAKKEGTNCPLPTPEELEGEEV